MQRQSLIPNYLKHYGRTLEPGFECDGKLWVVLWGSGAPKFDLLAIEMKDSLWSVTSLRDLKGRVKLTTGPAALAFARIRTQPELVLWNGGGAYEIIPTEDLDLAFLHGDVSELRFLDGLNADGVVSLEWFKSERLSRPVVTKRKGDWQISRYVVRIGLRGEGRVEHWEETVSPTGRYRCKARTVKLPLPTESGFWYELMKM